MNKEKEKVKLPPRYTEAQVRDAMARTAQQLVDSGMDPIKAEILVLKLAVKHERESRK